MSGMVRTIVAALCFSFAMAGAAKADMIDDVIRLYSPKLVSSRAVLECLIGGGSAQSCATQELTEGELSTDPDIHNIVELVQAVQAHNYPAVVARAGLGFACMYVDFEGKGVICNDFGGQIVAITTDAVGEAASLGASVANAFADLGMSIACTGGVLCSNGDTYDPSIEWGRCFTPRIREGVLARLSPGTPWWDLSHNTPNPQTIRINGHNRSVFLFAEGSVAGDCFNPRLIAFATLIGDNGQQRAQQMRQAFLPMFERYKILVEQTAAAELDDAQSTYHNAQQVWLIAAQTNAAQIFSNVAGTNNLLLQAGAVMGRRNACVAALNQPPAAMLAAWADSGQRVVSSQQAGPYAFNTWPANAPQQWCDHTFVPALQNALLARHNAYAAALANGCTQLARDRLHLTCAPGVGMASCTEAFAGIRNAQCTIGGPRLGPPPVTGAVTPQTTTPPPSDIAPSPDTSRQPAALPPITPRRRPG